MIGRLAAAACCPVTLLYYYMAQLTSMPLLTNMATLLRWVLGGMEPHCCAAQTLLQLPMMLSYLCLLRILSF